MKEIPLSNREYYSLQHWFAFISGLTTEATQLRHRLTEVDMLDVAEEVLYKAELILQELLPTIPLKKRKLILKNLENTTLEVKVVKDATGQEKPEFAYVKTSALDRLVDRVIDDNCLCCDKTVKQAKKCQIYKDIADVLLWELPPNSEELCSLAGMMTGGE